MTYIFCGIVWLQVSLCSFILSMGRVKKLGLSRMFVVTFAKTDSKKRASVAVSGFIA
jgi:hypothetical protein